MLTSDHADYAGNRGLLRKIPWFPFEDLARVPLFVAGRDVDGGLRLPHLVQSCDFTLTCLDYAGIEPPPGVDFGTRSLRPLLAGRPEADDLDRAVFCATSIGTPMVRRGPFKYMWQKGWKVSMLFDIEHDPTESNNLGDDPSHRAVSRELHDLLHQQLSLAVPPLPTFA